MKVGGSCGHGKAGGGRAADETATASKTRTASLTSPVKTYNDRKPTQGQLARDRDLLGGTWQIHRSSMRARHSRPPSSAPRSPRTAHQGRRSWRVGRCLPGDDSEAALGVPDRPVAVSQANGRHHPVRYGAEGHLHLRGRPAARSAWPRPRTIPGRPHSKRRAVRIGCFTG